MWQQFKLEVESAALAWELREEEGRCAGAQNKGAQTEDSLLYMFNSSEIRSLARSDLLEFINRSKRNDGSN
jgi:hypothetical protein